MTSDHIEELKESGNIAAAHYGRVSFDEYSSGCLGSMLKVFEVGLRARGKMSVLVAKQIRLFNLQCFNCLTVAGAFIIFIFIFQK